MKVSELLALDNYEFDRWVSENIVSDTKNEAMWIAIDFRSWSGMGRIIEKMEADLWHFRMGRFVMGSRAWFVKHGVADVVGFGSTYPEAVVIAAGLALGVLEE